MFRYKSVKHKNNYLSVKVPAGAALAVPAIEPFAAGSYFINLAGTTHDNHVGGMDWNALYNNLIPGMGNQRCASAGFGKPCGAPVYVGGHIYPYFQVFNYLRFNGALSNWVVTGLNQAQHELPMNAQPFPGILPPTNVYNQAMIYYIIPICSAHNNHHHFDVLMCTGANPDFAVRLNSFRSNYFYP